jgi:hypothetical protein
MNYLPELENFGLDIGFITRSLMKVATRYFFKIIMPI